MLSFFKRMFKITEAEAHAALDKLEDPIKMTEQGIRDLKNSLAESMKALAQAKAMAITLRKQAEEHQEIATDYEKKAMLLVEKAQKGELNQQESDRLASEALEKQADAQKIALSARKSLKQQEQNIAQLESKARKLKTQISTWENEMTTLKARAKVATASKKLNQQLAQIDSSSTITMLEKMKEKISEEEALSEAYEDLSTMDTSVDEEIDKALNSPTSGSSALAALKAKMNSNATTGVAAT